MANLIPVECGSRTNGCYPFRLRALLRIGAIFSLMMLTIISKNFLAFSSLKYFKEVVSITHNEISFCWQFESFVDSHIFCSLSFKSEAIGSYPLESGAIPEKSTFLTVKHYD